MHSAPRGLKEPSQDSERPGLTRLIDDREERTFQSQESDPVEGLWLLLEQVATDQKASVQYSPYRYSSEGFGL